MDGMDDSQTAVSDDVDVQGGVEQTAEDSPFADPIDESTENLEAADAGSGGEQTISSEVLARAKDYGLTDEDIAGFDDSRLNRMFANIDRRLMGDVQQFTQPQGGGAVPQSGVPGQPGQPEASSVDPTGFEEFKLELNDEIDESVAKPIQGVVEFVNKQLKDIHSFRHQAVAEMQAMNMLRDFADFDQFIESLGSDWSAEYGSGSTMDMDRNSREFKKRMEVYIGSQSLASEFARRGQPLMRRDAWKRSHHATFWDRHAEIERKKLGSKIDKRKGQFSERPSKGKTPVMSPREEAIAALQS